MYRVLATTSKTLISSSEVVFASPTASNVDVRFINTAIEIAEFRFIKNKLCTDFYNDFRNKKNQVVTDINMAFLQSLLPAEAAPLKVGQFVNAIEFVTNEYYLDLWNEILWKTIAECVIYIASPANYTRFSAQGETQNNPSSPIEGKDAASADLQTMKWKMDRMMQDRIDPLLAVMEEWLYERRSQYPLINCKNWGCDTVSTVANSTDGISWKRKTAWVFGVYPRDNSGCYCNEND